MSLTDTDLWWTEVLKHYYRVLEEIEVISPNAWLRHSQNPIKQKVTRCPYKSTTEHLLSAVILLGLLKTQSDLTAQNRRTAA